MHYAYAVIIGMDKEFSKLTKVIPSLLTVIQTVSAKNIYPSYEMIALTVLEFWRFENSQVIVENYDL